MLLAGTGRNVGKTTLACQLIEHFSLKNEIIAIKISSHFHELLDNNEILYTEPNLTIIQERNNSKNKDSSKLLLSGAKKVFYIQAIDETLPLALNWLKLNIKPTETVICEAGGLRKLMIPGLFIVCSGNDDKSFKYQAKIFIELADLIVSPLHHKVEMETFKLIDNRWMLTNS